MKPNPAYPTSNPNGEFKLYECGQAANLLIYGQMYSMPGPASEHGFTINQRNWDGRDCASSGKHFSPAPETHGFMNDLVNPSHVGDLNPIFDNTSGNASYGASARRPSLYGTTNNVVGRAMVIHEDPDDSGLGGNAQSLIDGNMGREIACCNISRYWVVKRPRRGYKGPQDVVPTSAGGMRNLSVDDEIEVGDEVISAEEFYELFGEEVDVLNDVIENN